MEGLNQETLCQIIAIFTKKNVAKGKSFSVKHFCQDGIPETMVYPVIEYAEATESVNHKEGIETSQNLTKPQEDIIKEKSRKQKLPPLQLQGKRIHSSELMYMNEFLCLFILVFILD